MDTHINVMGTTSSLVPGHAFNGILNGGLSADVNIQGMAAATVNSTAKNTPPHVPVAGSFASAPSNNGTIIAGSATVFINGKAAARNSDKAKTCNDPVDMPIGTVVATGTVMIGG